MKLRLPIRHQFALWINLLVVPVVILLSLLFYSEFRKAIDQRVLLQLTSIKQLKRVQIQDYLREKLAMVKQAAEEQASDGALVQFMRDADYFDIDSNAVQLLKQVHDGVHDLSQYDQHGKPLIGFKATSPQGNTQLWWIHAAKIQEILLERTGMGETGETYLVGVDSTLRSQSRFFPNRPPLEIKATTVGVHNALNGIEHTGLFPDYRGVPVYSSYGPLDVPGLKWAILSEIDEQEARAPLQMMQKRLLIISSIVIAVAILVSLQLAKQFTRPYLQMKELLMQMARGNFQVQAKSPSHGDEIEEMFNALDNLLLAIKQAMNYAREIGELKFDQAFQPLSEDDVLGRSLLQMRDQLMAFNAKEEQLRLANERALITGQEKEQARLARELHDGLGPLLTTLKLLVQRTDIDGPSKSQMKDLLDQTIAEVRRMTYNLMPQSLLDFGVGHTLTKWIDLVKRTTDVEIHYSNAMQPGNTLPAEIHIGLYRIAQEALNNALKHSQATKISLSLTEFDDHVSFFIQDNGRGFDPSTVSSGVGLVNMKERCRILKGTMHISTDDKGSRIEIEIPLPYA